MRVVRHLRAEQKQPVVCLFPRDPKARKSPANVAFSILLMGNRCDRVLRKHKSSDRQTDAHFTEPWRTCTSSAARACPVCSHVITPCLCVENEACLEGVTDLGCSNGVATVFGQDASRYASPFVQPYPQLPLSPGLVDSSKCRRVRTF